MKPSDEQGGMMLVYFRLDENGMVYAEYWFRTMGQWVEVKWLFIEEE